MHDELTSSSIAAHNVTTSFRNSNDGRNRAIQISPLHFALRAAVVLQDEEGRRSDFQLRPDSIFLYRGVSVKYISHCIGMNVPLLTP